MNPRQKSILVGAIVGAGLGALGGYLFTRGVDMSAEGEESQALTLRSVRSGDVVRLIIAVLGVLRGVAELGDRA